jgi:hypothetical protein
MKSSLLISAQVLILIGCANNEKSFVARFEGGDLAEQKWAIRKLNKDPPSDWSKFNYLTFDINASSTQRFYIKLYDAGGVRRMRRIQPFQGAWVRASIPLIYFQQNNVMGHDLAAIGKKTLPGITIGLNDIVGSRTVVDSIGLMMEHPAGNPRIEIKNLKLTMEPEDSILWPKPLVDEFGQWIPADWQGKAKTLNDLTEAWNEEDKSLMPSDFRLSRFGGFLDLKVKGTGFFRVEKIDGRWWFVDPDGYLFFSTGSNGINAGGSFSRVEGREYIFTAFPPEDISGSDRRIGKGAS